MDKDNDFMKDWLEGKISSDELKSKKDKGDKVVNEFDELITRSSRMKVPEHISQDDAWNKFASRVSEAPKQEAKIVSINRWLPLSIAASVALLVVAYFILAKTEIETQLAETRVHELPDGSKVTVNADSKIAFRKVGWSDNRVVSLEGEAFFDVKKGSSFTVETESGTVTVLGTSFNVKTRSGEFEVACYTGKVSVTSDDSNVVITKGLSTKLENNKLTEAEAFDDQQTTWRDGDFHFEAKSLRYVFDEMERQFNVEIVYSETTPTSFSGTLNNKDIDNALYIVLKPMGLSFRRENNRIIIQ